MFLFLARGMNTQWYKNHLANPKDSYIYYGFQKYELELHHLSRSNKLQVMREYVMEYPKWSKLGIGWNKNMDDPQGQLLADYIQSIEIVKIKLCDQKENDD